MEISYTKQQQKQKQKQQNKNQDSDTMDVFNKRNQFDLTIETDNYYQYTLSPDTDVPKIALGLPLSAPILSITYTPKGSGQQTINVYPTLQFLYSHHVQAEYITQEVKNSLMAPTPSGYVADPAKFCARFLDAVAAQKQGAAQQGAGDFELAVGQMVVLHGLLSDAQYNGRRGQIVCQGQDGSWGVLLTGADATSQPLAFKAENLQVARVEGTDDAAQQLRIKIPINHIRQNPQYTLAALGQGVYVIGMKDQLNVHDLQGHPLCDHVQYIVDEMGFVLFDKTTPGTESGKSVDHFGPYFIEQYILMEVLSKHEVAQNVLDYYVNHKQKLQDSLANYGEEQGKGFICWRFLMKEAGKGKACGSPMLRALARKKAASSPGKGVGGSLYYDAVEPMDEV